MHTAVVNVLGHRRDVGCVAIVPSIALVGEVVEGYDCEDQRKRKDAESSNRCHLACGMFFRWSVVDKSQT